MSVISQQTLLPDFIKMRWLEPHVSAGLNRKTFKSLPRGVYAGFTLQPGVSGAYIEIAHNDDRDHGLVVPGYVSGAFDAASGWSVAVHENVSGFTATVAINENDPLSDFVFDLEAYRGLTVYFALDVQYQMGYGSTAQIKLVDSTELDSDATLICLGRVDVPSVGLINDSNVIYDDYNYPRVLPFATKQKYGFMSKKQAEIVELLEVPGASPAFEEEVEITVDGPQEITIPNMNTYVVGGNDLFIYRNGVKSKKGASRDYTEIDRGDGKGEKIQWVGTTLKAGDRLIFRGQAYAVSLTNTLIVLDENAQIMANTIFMNFTGPGVSVLPDGPNRVKVVIPAADVIGANKLKTNNTLSGIPAYRAVCLLADNSIAPCDPTSLDPNIQKFYGITSQGIASFEAGYVFVDGFAPQAGVGVGTVGQDVYVSHAGDGSLTTTPPNPLNGKVIRVGILDGPEAPGQPAEDILFDRERLT